MQTLYFFLYKKLTLKLLTVLNVFVTCFFLNNISYKKYYLEKGMTKLIAIVNLSIWFQQLV